MSDEPAKTAADSTPESPTTSAEKPSTGAAADGSESAAPAAGSSTKTEVAANAPRTGIRRALAIAFGIYLLCTVVFSLLAGDRLEGHTQNNHFAVQAEVWHAGRWYLTEEDISARARRGELDMHNDWAVTRVEDPVTHRSEARYFNSFPVFPAVLMYPFVVAAGSAIKFRDAQFVVMIAGIAPALLFLALERLRAAGRLERTERQNAVLATLSALGTVYFFTSVQGSVWFAAHVVAAVLTGIYLLATLSSEYVWAALVAGIAVGCGWHTRTPFILCVPLFAFEAARASLRSPVRENGSVAERALDAWQKLDKRKLAARYALFSAPILLALWVTLSINEKRFGSPTEFGHTLLNVVWMERVKRYGLFSYHYLSRNLTCAFTLLPIVNPADAPPGVGHVQVSGNGLALWFTTPLYLWLLWPKRRGPLFAALWATVLPIALLDLLYQNSGWVQFGYRFSNDYSMYLFLLLAVGARPMRWRWSVAASWALAVNLWGALSFERAAYRGNYFLQTYSVPIYNGKTGLQSSTYAPD
jgi:hypothetical protein